MSNPGLIKSYKVGAAVAPRRIVTLASGEVVQATAATDALIGVSDLGAANAGDVADVVLSDLADVEYGGNVAEGDWLTADDDGKAVAAAPGAGAYASIIGQAMVAGADGDIGLVHIAKHTLTGETV
ncbi:DUF2190 family protein [Roseospirillum parvum]|uniref:DUF2190 domain-containing protein n=1 Tax=Roseospirillum parvum TaxID=83401 RepID=A0A1G8GD14_9PROT|nr:DUF2190 family protein [Roseospirillum parvum]SDH92253.1 hypothetical protein SAMN05421742_1245 [Roseospirillum parvum]